MRILTSLLLFASTCWASPHFSIEYIHYDIIRAQEHGHRIYEVQVLNYAVHRQDSITVPANALDYPPPDSRDSFTFPRTTHKVEFKVVSSLMADPFPASIPLIAFDQRGPHFWRFWEKEIREKHPEMILVLDSHGRIVALYPETSMAFYTGRDEDSKRMEKLMKEGFIKDILKVLDDKRYADRINRNRILQILEKSGLMD